MKKLNIIEDVIREALEFARQWVEAKNKRLNYLELDRKNYKTE